MVVIPKCTQTKIRNVLNTGHFGILRTKRLARSSVYLPGIDKDIVDLCHRCEACEKFQNRLPKPPIHSIEPGTTTWSRIHIDHGINFLGYNWLIVVDSFSKYPCIHKTSSVCSASTTEFLEEDFAHFDYPHYLISDNATAFTSSEFQKWCDVHAVINLREASYHLSTKGLAEIFI